MQQYDVLGPRVRRWWEHLLPADRDYLKDQVAKGGRVDRRVVPVPMDFGVIISWSGSERSNFQLFDDVCDFVEEHQ